MFMIVGLVVFLVVSFLVMGLAQKFDSDAAYEVVSTFAFIPGGIAAILAMLWWLAKFGG